MPRHHPAVESNVIGVPEPSGGPRAVQVVPVAVALSTGKVVLRVVRREPDGPDDTTSATALPGATSVPAAGF